MIFTGEIELCFWDPKRDLPPGKDRGVLYLLRRDLTELYGREDDAPSQTHKAPMLASIGMMTGLDLMSKLATNDLSGGRNIFKRFVENYGRLSPADAEVIYKLRCAQTHAYCLIDLDEKAKTEYCFVLIDDHPEHPHFNHANVIKYCARPFASINKNGHCDTCQVRIKYER